MRVTCIHIPRKAFTEAGAIYDTTWDLVNAKFFLHVLDDLSEAMHQPFSLELYSSSNTIYVCMAGSDEILEYLCMGIFSFMSDAEIRDVEDYTYNIDERTVVVGADLYFQRPDIYPIIDYRPYAIDSMAPFVAAMSNLPEGDRLLYQVVCKPIRDGAKSQAALLSRRAAEKVARAFNPRLWCKADLKLESLDKAKAKCLSHLYWVSIRAAAMTRLPKNAGAAANSAATQRLTHHVHNTLSSAFLYNTIDENRFKISRMQTGSALVKRLQKRSFHRPIRLASIELTTLFHPPGLGTLPNTAQVLSKKAPPPRKLPTNVDDPQICFFGKTNYRENFSPFGIKRFDRRRHMYILGKSGVGKSCLMQLLVKSDIDNGYGCAVLDPHGDLVDDILKLIPRNRVKDVVLLDPADIKHPPSFNPMTPAKAELLSRVTNSFIDTFRRNMADSWSDKMDHVLRYAMNGLLSIPGVSVVGLRRMLSDEEFRAEVVKRSTDESVQRFWLKEFSSRRKEFEEGPVSQLLNRLDQLLATDMVRNILGQSNNLFDFREFMDNRKIVLLKVSKGVLGADNASLLGSLAIWKIYEAAMSRADIASESRQDFYFYIDEFQNFATESFGEILSESRKYKLCLTFANQFLGQLPESIRQTVFGNVANILSFRIGPDDSGSVAKEFNPIFGGDDFLNLGLREFAVKMSVDGEVQEAFSGGTLDLKYPHEGDTFVRECLAQSRSKYALTVDQVEEEIALSEFDALRRVANS